MLSCLICPHNSKGRKMASVTNGFHCCDDCACAIANADTSGLDYYGPEYRAEWEAGIERIHNEAIAMEFDDRNPVIACPDKQEFNCDHCGRNVYSHKFDLAYLP